MKPFLLFSLLACVSFFQASGQDRIYWGFQGSGTTANDALFSVNAADLGSLLTSVSGSSAGFNPSGVAYFHANPTYPLFYIGDTDIYRNNLSGTANLIINPAGQFNRGLAIDYIGKKIYWCNSQEGYIGRADLDGSNKDEAFITGLNNPWDIEIDPINEKIYWSEDDNEGEISRANLADGTNKEALVHDIDALGVAVDPLRNKIYYTKFPDGTVFSANLDGSGAGAITGLFSIADIDVDIATGNLYMISYGPTELTKANADGTGKTTITANGLFITYADVTTPVISSIVRKSPTQVNIGQNATATFRITFSEPVLKFDTTDLQKVGGIGGYLSMVPVSLNKVFDVNVSTISGTGTLGLMLRGSQNIVDFRGNPFTGTINAAETYTVVAAPNPVVTSFDPVTGPVGAVVTITGSGFSATAGDNTVTFNGIIAPVTGSTTTSITIAVPAGATTGPIAVTTNGLTGTSMTDFVICTPPPKPTITRQGNLLTSSADVGNQWFYDYLEIPGATGKTHTAMNPGAYMVKVTVAGCTSNSDALDVSHEMLTPVITNFSPTSGTPGTVVTITGTTFSAIAAENTVKFNGVTAQVTASTPTSITTSVPAGASTGPISVTYNGHTAASSTNFTFICIEPPKPTIEQEGGLLTSSSDVNNQWLKNDVVIPGATNKTYTAIGAGAYSVRITVDGCTSQSDPTTIVGIEEPSATSVMVYPNPSTAIVNIEWVSAPSESRVEIYSMTGVKKESFFLESKHTFDMSGYQDGMYLVVITTNDKKLRKKIQKLSFSHTSR